MSAPIRLVHRVDPKQQIWDAIWPWVEEMRVRPYDVMLGMYLREKIEGEKMTRSGILIPDNGTGSLREDLFTGKVGVVMKVGSMAFTDDESRRWEDFKPRPMDWVVINTSDSFWFDIPGGWRVRVVEDTLVRLIVQAPDFVW